MTLAPRPGRQSQAAAGRQPQPQAGPGHDDQADLLALPDDDVGVQGGSRRASTSARTPARSGPENRTSPVTVAVKGAGSRSGAQQGQGMVPSPKGLARVP
jgi:hypothetical protein